MRKLASFGRRKGRKLRTSKQDLFDTLLPALKISLDELNGSSLRTEGEAIQQQKDGLPRRLTPSRNDAPSPIWLEIGFGGGEHLAYLAGLHPEVQFIGCEPYINGISGLLTHINEHNLTNIRIYADDARDLIANLPDAALSQVFILYPDPWHKTRHNKRRLISTEFLNSLTRVMKNGAILRLATDNADYATWMLERLLAHKNFKWQAKTCSDWLNPPPQWISTKYEQKAIAGRPTYLNFIRQENI